MAISAVMLSHRSTIDRIAAFDLVQQAVGRELDIIFANQTDNLSAAEAKGLAEKGVVLIGVGRGRTYRERQIDGKKLGSETELLLNDLLATVLPKTPVLADFSAMMSRNNKDGYLVHQSYSVNRIIRDAYRLGHDPEEVGYTFSDQEVVRRGAHVVRMYLNAREREKDGLDLGARERIKCMPAVELLPEWARFQNGPMTVLRYMRDMCVLGVSEDELRERASWFIGINDRAAEKEMEAEMLVDAADFETFKIPCQSSAGTWAESDDPYLLKALAGRRDLVVMRSHLGNVIIMSKAFNLAKVGAAMQTQEPGLWHIETNLYGKSRNIVANGTESVHERGTGLSRVAIEYIIGTNVIRKER